MRLTSSAFSADPAFVPALSNVCALVLSSPAFCGKRESVGTDVDFSYLQDAFENTDILLGSPSESTKCSHTCVCHIFGSEKLLKGLLFFNYKKRRKKRM